MQVELNPLTQPPQFSQLSFDDLAQAEPVIESPITTVKELLERFPNWLRIEVADGDASMHTIQSYISSTKCYLSWCERSSIDPTSVIEDDMKLYRAFLVDQDYQRGTIGTKLAGIRRFYDALVYWGERPDNPVKNVKAKRDLTSGSDRVLEKYIPNRERFINLFNLPSSRTISGKRDRALLRLMCYTGIRVSELSALDIIDLDLGEKPQLIIRAGKGHKKRHVPLGDEDIIAIQDWLAFRGMHAKSNTEPIFITLDNRTHGRRLGTRGIRSIVDKYLDVAGLKKLGRSCHALRHSFATWMLDAGVPIEAIADLLGHSSVAITAIYAKVVDHRKYIPSDILSLTE